MAEIDELNKEVTSRIKFAEELEYVGSPFTKVAWHEVSNAELRLVGSLEWGSVEWKIACRGVIRAAIKSENAERVRSFITFLNDSELIELMRELVRN